MAIKSIEMVSFWIVSLKKNVKVSYVNDWSTLVVQRYISGRNILFHDVSLKYLLILWVKPTSNGHKIWYLVLNS